MRKNPEIQDIERRRPSKGMIKLHAVNASNYLVRVNAPRRHREDYEEARGRERRKAGEIGAKAQQGYEGGHELTNPQGKER